VKDDLIRGDPRPLYARAQAAVIARIRDGIYQPGGQLPAEDQLAAEFGVSRTTIRSALANLEALGYIHRIHGAGTFVAQRRFQVEAEIDALESFHPRLAARLGRSSQISHLRIAETSAAAEIAAATGLRAGEPVISVARVVEFDGVPVVHLEDFLPIAICDCAVDTLRAGFADSVIDYFDGREGRPVIEWSDSSLYADRADTTLAGLLRVKPGEILFRLDETFYAGDGRLVSWSRNHIVPEYFKFHTRRRVTHREANAEPVR
jgi:GntR family transcriptional regulator